MITCMICGKDYSKSTKGRRRSKVEWLEVIRSVLAQKEAERVAQV